jgi:alanine racemase
MRPVHATISLSALRHNLAIARSRAAGSRVWAVVKANGYGHGLLRAVAAFDAADGFALVEVDAAARLREQGCTKPLLMIEGFFSPEELAEYSARGLVAVVHNIEQVRMLEKSGLAAEPVLVYLKINTGMNRLGFRGSEARHALERLRACPSVSSIVLMTHFADADGESGVAGQLAQFRALNLDPSLPRTLANSAALLRYPETHADWVRPGIMLYGCSPFSDESAQAIGLRPAMTLRSRIIAVQELQPGAPVGYGAIYTAREPMRIGIVACGYAHGYPRHAPGFNDRGAPIIVDGMRTRIVGRVSMDMLAADITRIPQAGVGTEVILWGEGLSADEVAAAAETLSYELLCALAPHVRVIETE